LTIRQHQPRKQLAERGGYKRGNPAGPGTSFGQRAGRFDHVLEQGAKVAGRKSLDHHWRVLEVHAGNSGEIRVRGAR
jgi:hypothetical protein